MLPLEGVHVVDTTQNVAGPYASMILAELGANVIKVEPPAGDATRRWGPPFWEGLSPTYLALNRNKSHIELDLKTEHGKNKILELIENADVFIESSRPGATERLGLGYEVLKKQHPRLIYAEINAYGNSGPKASHSGYDPLMQAYGGIMSVTGQPGQDPVRVGVSINDMGTGLWVAIGILGALRLREKTGFGQKVTGSLYETTMSWMSYHISSYWASGEAPKMWGSGTAMIAPYEAFPTKDKWIIIAAGNDSLFEKLCHSLRHEEWLKDIRFLTNALRLEHRKELYNLIREVVIQNKSNYWIDQLEEAGIPIAPVLNVEEMVKEPQFQESGMVQSIHHPKIADFKSIGLPLKFNNERPALRMRPPI